ncbi:MAG: 23S rRNA (pseudouridine(1915)-N(3))-methyltransferase RlmH [Bacteroidales bacterium]|nr:23S rRNA (pseudouridine(1915)-N(3))-methyltransferase RlmH [Bacteroidales bacterium]
MKITLLNVGKTDDVCLERLIGEYAMRINKFAGFEMEYILLPKGSAKFKPDELKKAEGDALLKKMKNFDYVVLLDENGKHFNSAGFAQYLQKIFNASPKNLLFVVGGAYGFSKEVYQKTTDMLSLSSMTTTHQLVRLYFVEQLYRAFTIINNHPYHNN